MISVEEIKKHYSNHENRLPRAVLKEYLQHKILKIIFASKFGNKMVFMGGTAIRIIYGSDRFSEDLDLNNTGMSEKNFLELIAIIGRELKKEGIESEIRNVFKGVYRCYLKFPRLLYENKLSPLPDEKILIQIDSFRIKENIKSVIKIINRVDIFAEVRVYPADIILSQKIYSLFNRQRAKGRDIYDIVYLYSLTDPNREYLKKYLKINDKKSLISKLTSLFDDKQLLSLAKDVEPFLINPTKKIQIEKFNQWLKQQIIY